MDEQPEALRLGDELVALHGYPLSVRAAAELRRLHEVNQELLEALKNLSDYVRTDMIDSDIAREIEAAIAKAQGETK